MIRKILIALLLITTFTLSAQRTNSSPYSFFGIGDEFNATTVEQSAMGGIGVAYSHYKYLNFTNPAAYSSLRYTTYAFGMLNNDLTVKSGTSKQSSTSTSLSYIAIGIPLSQKAGMSLGLQPVSSVGYSLSNTILDANGDISEVSLFAGNGGVNRIYGSFGIEPFKNFSVGIEADYSFGNIDNSIKHQKIGVALATKFEEVAVIRGGSVKLGAQYKKELKDQKILTLGATFKLGNDFEVTGNDYLYSLSFSSTGTEIPRDTTSTSSINGKFNMPLKTTLGVGLGKIDKWYAGLEYENQNSIEATGFLNTTNNAYKYGKSNRFSLGGFYLPKINSISSYWNRVTYRAGLRFEKTGLLVDGSGNNSNFAKVDDFGMSFGLGLPLKRMSTVNMGFEFGKRGTTDNNLIEENYFNFRLSLSLTDLWFIKRKID